MSFVKNLKFTTSFEGAAVSATLLPLEFEDWLDMRGSANQNETVRRWTTLLPKYVKDLSGVKSDDGSSLTVEEVCKYAYFRDLVGEIGMNLLKRGIIQDPSLPVVPSDG